jgi:hypothetical protein
MVILNGIVVIVYVTDYNIKDMVAKKVKGDPYNHLW